LKIPYSKYELFRCGSQPTYKGRNLDEIAFPLGGIGTGSISLGGWGQLRDWEIMNRPAKSFVIPRSFFTLKVRFSNGTSVTKILQGPVEGSYVGDGRSLSHVRCSRDTGQGLPHFRNVSFTGHFPIATVSLSDPDLPIEVTLEAFNPFIPLNDKDSSIPVAIFFYHVKNLSNERITATIYGNLTNIIGYPELLRGDINEAREDLNVKGLYLSTTKINPDSPSYGSMVLATTWPDSSVWTRWKGRDHRACIAKFWEAVALSDDFPPEPGESNTGTVAANFSLKPAEEVTVPFMISWYFPNFIHYWREASGLTGSKWRNYYATIWKDAWDVALYVASNLDRLWRETKLFHDSLFSSTLPIHVLDAVSSQLSTLKTNTCIRLEDGTFYGFEGCNNQSGCCPGSCTHVWNYAQALPYLFPNLQRSMLDAHLTNSIEKDGFMTFRMPLPLGTKAKPIFHPAADGQMGIILQVYRQWLIEGDDKWLKSVWPITKKILEFAWKYWDADKDGVMEGMQHNTYDIEFYGPNTMTGSLYLAALRAAEEIARYLGEYDEAQEYRELFEKGSRWYDENLFNGEYYEQKVNPKAHEIWPEHIRQLALRHGKDDKFKDWPKWQFGKGCLSDQLIGQWYSHMLGLGYLFYSKNIKRTLESIFKYNWKPTLWDHPCTFRIYALQDEAGLIICTWPKGERPGYAFYFADEVWCGIEYQVASHMIYEGMIEEGLAIVMGTRRRHRGDRRNPWDEFECGHHYARSMASYALLLALSGFRYSATTKRLHFSPKIFQNNFCTFFTTARGWGLYRQRIQDNNAEFSLELKYGSLSINELEIPRPYVKESEIKVKLDDKKIDAKIKIKENSILIRLNSTTINQGQTLKIILIACDK